MVLRLKTGERSEESYRLEIKAAYEAIGCVVVNFSQARRSRQTPGIPDLKVYNGEHTWWHEVKRPGQTQSPVQKQFQAMAEAAGELYVCGDYDAMAWALRYYGLVDQPQSGSAQL